MFAARSGQSSSRNGVRGPRLLNGAFTASLAGWTATPNTSTVSWQASNGGEAYFGGGSANVGAQLSQIVRLRANNTYNISFAVNTAGSGGTTLMKCDVLNAVGVIIATVTGTSGLFATTPDFSGPGVTVLFTDVSTGNMASQDVRLDTVALNKVSTSHRFNGNAFSQIGG